MPPTINIWVPEPSGFPVPRDRGEEKEVEGLLEDMLTALSDHINTCRVTPNGAADAMGGTLHMILMSLYPRYGRK